MNFQTIRTWNGSQHRAFEELSNQLLKGEAPPGSTVVRTGNPDGGVEWFATLSNGDEWGWQAKFIYEIDDVLRAMTESVQAIVVQRPSIVRLFVIIPINLATGRPRGTRKSQREKYEDKVKAWKRDIPGANRIEFELIQESNLLDKLSRIEHRGRRWFWWDENVFRPDWLESLFKHQARTAGEKYRPDLQVDLPIASDLRALGLSQSTISEFSDLRRRIAENLQRMYYPDFEDPECSSAALRVRPNVDQLFKELAREEPLSCSLKRLELWKELAGKCLIAIGEFIQTCYRWRQIAEDESRSNSVLTREFRDRIAGALHAARTVQGILYEFQEWLEGSAINAARTRAYFLTGAAGSGKTHLLLDGVSTALAEGRPAALLHGAHFRGDLWTSICDQLGLPPLGRDVLLDALDSAAEAAGRDGRRFVIAVDALNETSDQDYWRSFLPALRSAIADRSHLSLAVLCRTTYVDAIDPERRRDEFVNAQHPGFAGREFEATQKYFDHYGLEAPRIPLLSTQRGP